MRRVKYNKKTGSLLFGKAALKTGMERLDSAGLACYQNQYSLLYRLAGDTDGIFQVLRFYDIRFQILADLKERTSDLKITETYDSQEQAKKDLGILEADMRENLGCMLERMELSERMSLFHRMAAGDAGYINTDSYIHGGDWLPELCMEQVKEEAGYLAFGAGTKHYYQISSLRNPCSIPAGLKHTEHGVRYLAIDFAPVTDEGIRLYMEEKYLGLERMEKSFHRHSTQLYDVLFGPGLEDRRLFVLAGVSLVRSFQAPEFKELDQRQYHSCRGIQKQMYQSLLPGAAAGITQMRVCSSEAASSFLDKVLNGKEQ